MNKSTLFLILWTGIFIAILVFIYQRPSPIYETFQDAASKPPSIRFLTSDETRNVLLADKDDYYKGFSQYDLIARNINTVEEYKEQIRETPVDPTEDQKTVITQYINEVHRRVSTNASIDGFNLKKFRSIPLNIGIVSGKTYEHGLPHTRENVIILSIPILDTYSTEKLIGTMSHEMMHIYQKEFPEEVSKYLDAKQIIEDKTAPKDPLRRANPDLNNIVYRDKNGVPYYAKYSSERPKNVADVIFSQTSSQRGEHPYEQMAIEFEKNIIA